MATDSKAETLPAPTIVRPKRGGHMAKGPNPFVAAIGIAVYSKQPGETGPAWAAFILYRDMGPSRSHVRTTEALGRPPGYVGMLTKWSRINGWVERVNAWDSHQDDVARAAKLKAIAGSYEEMKGVAEGMWKLAGLSCLAWLDTLAEESRKAAAEGRAPKPLISPSQTAQLADIGMKLHRLIDGETTEKIEAEVTVAIQSMDFGAAGMVKF